MYESGGVSNGHAGTGLFTVYGEISLDRDEVGKKWRTRVAVRTTSFNLPVKIATRCCVVLRAMKLCSTAVIIDGCIMVLH